MIFQIVYIIANVAMVLNFGQQKFLKIKSGQLLKKVGHPFFR